MTKHSKKTIPEIQPEGLEMQAGTKSYQQKTSSFVGILMLTAPSATTEAARGETQSCWKTSSNNTT
jgi:hypothetical protein